MEEIFVAAAVFRICFLIRLTFTMFGVHWSCWLPPLIWNTVGAASFHHYFLYSCSTNTTNRIIKYMAMNDIIMNMDYIFTAESIFKKATKCTVQYNLRLSNPQPVTLSK